MTRATKSARPPTFAEQLARDPRTAVIGVLRESAVALDASAIRRRLVDRGVEEKSAKDAWARAQPKIRYDEHIIFDSNTYRWTDQPREVLAEEALHRIERGGESARHRAFVAIIRGEIESLSAAKPDVVESPHEQYERAERRRAARERQARIDAISAAAELAAEVEELTAKRAKAEVLLQHVRSLTGRAGLEAIGRAGEPTSYNASVHNVMGEAPDDGAAVTVIRPGYVWHAPGEDVVLSKALVTTA